MKFSLRKLGIYHVLLSLAAILLAATGGYAGAGIAAVIVAVGGVVLYRVTRHTLLHDMKSVARMFEDIRGGGLRVDYPVRLAEFRTLLHYINKSGGKLVRERRKLADMGLTDHLSQLANRRALEARLEQLFAQARIGFPSSVLMIDLDHFKQVNDKSGHDVGDDLIVQVAQEFRRDLRHTDFVARLGGDEFCILFPYTKLDTATELVTRLRQKLPKELALIKGVVHSLMWTGGLSCMDAADQSPEDVLWRADQALLQAKTAGRNRTEIYATSEKSRTA